MYSRPQSGASLILVVACTAIIVLVGVGMFFLSQLFGGFRELQHATDAGNLNVAKQASKAPSFVPISNYQADFAGLVDGHDGMDLQAYNRCVGQAFLVSMNAMADRPQGNSNGSPSLAGLQNAAIACQTANGGDPSNRQNAGIGQSLYQRFTTTTTNTLFPSFGSVANSNSTRMLGADGRIQSNIANFDTAFMEPGGSTNVWLDNSILPYVGDSATRLAAPAGVLSSQRNSGGNSYLAGYVKMPLGAGGNTFSLAGVPVFPNNQPHLVSARDFEAAKSRNDGIFTGIVPPNAYKSVSNAPNQSSLAQTRMESYSLAGVLGNDYPVSIPQGYIQIVNPPGFAPTGLSSSSFYDGTYSQPLLEADSVFSNELVSGIYLATTNSGGAAFSTDPNILTQWAAYNANPSQNPQPPLIDPVTGQPLVFFSNAGDHPTNITAAGFQGQTGDCPCFWTDTPPSSVQGGWWTFLGSQPCQGLLPAFMAAYPSGQPYNVPLPDQLTAVEALKYEVISDFYMSKDPSTWTLPNFPGVISPPTTGSGLRYWKSCAGEGSQVTHDGQPSPILPQFSPQISVPGTIHQLIDEVAPTNEGVILRQIAQRMREIDPTTSEDWAQNWLTSNGQTFELGTVYYIYKNSAGWQLTATPPPGKHQMPGTSGALQDVQADGSLQQYLSDQINPKTGIGGYQTIGTMVDPIMETGVEILWGGYPNPNKTSRGVDVVQWQPSSGYGNLLGTLTFWNYCSGPLTGKSVPGGNYLWPN